MMPWPAPSRHWYLTPGGRSAQANRWETAYAGRHPALRCLAVGGRDGVESRARDGAGPGDRPTETAATRSTPVVNHASTRRPYSVSGKAVSAVDSVDTFVGIALLFAAVAIALRLVQSAILGRDRVFDPRTQATRTMADR